MRLLLLLLLLLQNVPGTIQSGVHAVTGGTNTDTFVKIGRSPVHPQLPCFGALHFHTMGVRASGLHTFSFWFLQFQIFGV